MKKNEKLNEKESFALGVYIAGLYKRDGLQALVKYYE